MSDSVGVQLKLRDDSLTLRPIVDADIPIFLDPVCTTAILDEGSVFQPPMMLPLWSHRVSVVITDALGELAAAADCLWVTPPAPILGGTTTDDNGTAVSPLTRVARATPLMIRLSVLLSIGLLVSAVDTSRSFPVFCLLL